MRPATTLPALPALRPRRRPARRVSSAPDHLLDAVHHFDVPRRHARLALTAHAVKSIWPRPAAPASARPRARGNELDRIRRRPANRVSVSPALFARSDPAAALWRTSSAARLDDDGDPLTLSGDGSAIHRALNYAPQVDARRLAHRRRARRATRHLPGFRHIMLAPLRGPRPRLPLRQRLPLAPRKAGDRSASVATHAWVEARLRGSAGLGSTPPTTSSQASGTSASASGATTRTCPPPAASSRAKPPPNSRSPSRSNPATPRPPPKTSARHGDRPARTPRTAPAATTVSPVAG